MRLRTVAFRMGIAPWVLSGILCGLTSLISGCGSSPGTKPAPPKPKVIGAKTQDIGKFDPQAKAEVSDSKVRVNDPVLGPLQAYGPMVEQISTLAIQDAVNKFYALEGRYPKNYEEFMARIIKENNIQLPVLPFGKKYQYNEETHALVIINAPPPGKPAAEQKE